MAITFVQSKTGTVTGASLTITLGSATTAGNCLIVAIMANGSGSNPTVSGVTLGGSAGNFASVLTTGTATYVTGAIWNDPDCAGGQTSVVISSTGGSGTITLAAAVYEFSGLLTASPADKTASNGGTSTLSASWSSTATATLSQASEVAVGMNVGGGTALSISGPGAPWTNVAQVGPVSSAMIAGYHIVSATTALTYAGTVTPNSGSTTLIATFKAATATAGAAALSAAASVSAAGTFTIAGAAAMSAAASVSAAAIETLQQAAAMSAAASVTAAGHETVHEAAALSAAASLTAVPPYTPPPPPPVSSAGLTAELDVGGWTGITSYVYQRDTVQLQRGRQNEASTMQPATASLTLNNRDFRFTTRNPAGAYYPNLVQNTPLRLSVPSANAGIDAYLRLETDQASYISCPDSSGLQITSGTLSVRWDGMVTDWTSFHILVSKEGATANAWTLYTQGDGTIALNHYDSGAVQHVAQSTVPVPYYSGRIAVRADYNISAQTITFYTAPTMAGSWTQLGGVDSTPATSLAAGTGQAVQVGNGQANIYGLYGNTYEAQVLASGTLKADPVFTVQRPGATSFIDVQGNTWTLSGTAEISDRLYRFHGEMSSIPKAADPGQRDVYSQATAYGVTQRLQNANEPLSSPMYRAYVRLPADLNLAAYWPCEDGTNATSIGSATGGPPMQIINGTPELAANSDFACSAPLPNMNGATFLGVVPAGTTFTDCSVRFLLEVPAAGETSDLQLAYVAYSGSTIAYGSLVYTTGGYLNWTVYNIAGSALATTGAVHVGPGGGSVDGALMRIGCDLINDGTSVTVQIQGLTPGATQAWEASATLASTTVPAARSLYVAAFSSVMGHISVQGVWDSLFDLNDYAAPDGTFTGPMSAWTGEPAAVRVARLCAEEGISCRIIGPPETSAPMGYQPIDTLSDILQECENTDLGMLSDLRQVLGIGYRTRTSLYHQPPGCTASFPARALSEGFGSTGDTQLIVNDVTATAPDGSTARQILAAGAMSVQDPPSGIGRISTEIEPNPQFDSQLSQLAAWYLNVRSVDDDRYPAIPFQMTRPETPAPVLLLDIGDYLQLTGTPGWIPPPPVSQLCAGFTETYYPQPYWLLNVNGIPELPYETAVFDTARFDTAGSTLTATITSAATSLSATSPGLPWTTAAGSLPFDIVIDREQMTVTAVSGATSPQTLTVTRSVNGVAIAHTAGAAIALYHKPVLAL